MALAPSALKSITIVGHVAGELDALQRKVAHVLGARVADHHAVVQRLRHALPGSR